MSSALPRVRWPGRGGRPPALRFGRSRLGRRARTWSGRLAVPVSVVVAVVLLAAPGPVSAAATARPTHAATRGGPTAEVPEGLDTNLVVGVGPVTSTGPASDVGDIDLSDADGSNARVVQVPLEPGQAIYSPDLSPDGSRIVFVEDLVGFDSSQLYLVNSDGTGLVPIVPAGQPPFSPFHPRWSPDGSEIVFDTVTSDTGTEGGIWTVHPDGTGLTQLTTTGAAPSWSPDGSQVVFADAADDSISTVPASGGPPHVLVSTFPDYPENPLWAPDGKHIAFQVAPYGSVQSVTMIVGADGSGLTEAFTLPAGYQGSWAPDGHRLVLEEGPDSGIYGLDGSWQAPDPVGAFPSWIRTSSAAVDCQGGYRLAAGDGGVFAYGHAAFYGSMGGTPLNAPIVGIAATPSGRGYWLVAADGGVFAFGDAGFEGSLPALGVRPHAPVVGIAATPSGRGYWLVAADGGVFAFGDAGFEGSHGASPLNAPVVAMAATPAGGGYWLAAADGGVFAYGDAPFEGSHGGAPLNRPVVAMAATADGAGYWLVAADGGVFAYGDAPFVASGVGPLTTPVVGIVPSTTDHGYLIVSGDGGVQTPGDEQFCGAPGALNQPLVGASS